MTRIRCIPHAWNFSRASGTAFRRTVEMARANGAELIVAHVMSPVVITRADTPTGAGYEFVFRRSDGTTIAEAGSLLEFCRVVTGGLDAAILDHHARGRDFSRWVQDIFSDAHLASQFLKVERRWARGEIDDLGWALARPVALRYGTEGATSAWPQDRRSIPRRHDLGSSGQCDMKTGTVIVWRRCRVAPPRITSRSRVCP